MTKLFGYEIFWEKAAGDILPKLPSEKEYLNTKSIKIYVVLRRNAF